MNRSIGSRGTIVRTLAGLVSGAIAGAAVSAFYQTYGARRDRRRFPPPGRMVDVGGRRIHLWTAGTGSPTVVIVPGLGEPGLNWAALLPELTVESSIGPDHDVLRAPGLVRAERRLRAQIGPGLAGDRIVRKGEMLVDHHPRAVSPLEHAGSA